MEEVRKKNDDWKLLLLAFMYLIFQGIGLVMWSINESVELNWIADSVFIATLCFLLYNSYHTHNKNVMKPLLGGLLLVLLIDCFEYSFYYIQYFNEIPSWHSNSSAMVSYAIITIILCVTISAINILHYIISASHHSSPKKVKAIRVLYILFIVLIIAEVVCLVIMDSTKTIAVVDALTYLSDVFVMGMIIYIESKMDFFRLEREAVDNEEMIETQE